MLVLSKGVLTKKIIFLPIVAILISLIEVTVALAGNAYKDIRCSIEISDSKSTKAKETMVHVKIEHLADEIKNFELSPAFELVKEGSEELSDKYWSPVDINSGAPRVIPGKSINLTLGSNETRTLDVDLLELNWARQVSSIWPFENLYSVVPPGQYKFYLSIEIPDKGYIKIGNMNIEKKVRVFSNEVMVVIE